MKVIVPTKLNRPRIKIVSPRKFDDSFHKGYRKGLIGYGVTKIFNNGNVKIYVKNTYKKGHNQQEIAHERKELKIWHGLVKRGLDPYKAELVAHNLNPVRTSNDVTYLSARRWEI